MYQQSLVLFPSAPAIITVDVGRYERMGSRTAAPSGLSLLGIYLSFVQRGYDRSIPLSLRGFRLNRVTPFRVLRPRKLQNRRALYLAWNVPIEVRTAAP